MSTKLAVSIKNAAYMMIDAGLTSEQVQEGVNTLERPADYYVYNTDVLKYIKKVMKKYRKNCSYN